MKEYEVFFLVGGMWEFERIINATSRKSASEEAHKVRQSGTVKIRRLAA